MKSISGFMASTPYTTIPISVYRKIEVDIKKYLWFVPTEEGKKSTIFIVGYL